MVFVRKRLNSTSHCLRPCSFILPCLHCPHPISVSDVHQPFFILPQCNITAMPTYHFYKVGALVHMVRGASEEQLRAGVLAHSGDKWSNMQGHLLTATSSSSSGESPVSQSAAVPHAAPASAAEMRAARAAAAEARMRALQAQAK